MSDTAEVLVLLSTSLSMTRGEQGRYPAKGQMVCHGCGARGPLAWTLEEARKKWNGMPRKEEPRWA